MTEVLQAWKQDSDVHSDKIILLKNVDGEFIGLSTVDISWVTSLCMNGFEIIQD